MTGGFTKDQGNEVFGRLIAVRRAALGLSQEALAARMETSKRNVAGIENGVPPRLEMLERLGAALVPEPTTHPARRPLGRRLRWGGLAIAILVPALVILNGHAGDGGGGASAERLPRVESRAPTDPAPVVRVYTRAKPRRETPSEGRVHKRKAHSTTGAAPQEGSPATGEDHWGPAPETTLKRTAPATPGPSPPSAASPQLSDSSSPPAPLKPTGKPAGTPGNGPGGGSGGGNGTGGGNGPGGTGPPGQNR